MPGVRERAEAGELAFGTVDSWMAWRLSGGRRHVTDATNASRTLLYDIREGAWDDELLALFGVPRALLPEVVDSSGVIGETDPALLGAAVPIAGMAGDQQAALFGQACTRRGMIKVTYGTGCFLLLHTGDEPAAAPPGLVSTVALQRGGRRTYALEGSVFIGGAAVQWLRDGLGIVGSGAEATALAQSVPSSDGVVFVPALAGLGAPYWDPYARGGIFGLTRGTTRGAHRPRHARGHRLPGRRPVPGRGRRRRRAAPAEVRADGGAAASDLLLQFQADLLGVPVTRAGQPEATAFGAAWLAGLATGVWASEEEVGGALERRRGPSRRRRGRRRRPAPALAGGGGRRARVRARDAVTDLARRSADRAAPRGPGPPSAARLGSVPVRHHQHRHVRVVQQLERRVPAERPGDRPLAVRADDDHVRAALVRDGLERAHRVVPDQHDLRLDAGRAHAVGGVAEHRLHLGLHAPLVVAQLLGGGAPRVERAAQPRRRFVAVDEDDAGAAGVAAQLDGFVERRGRAGRAVVAEDDGMCHHRSLPQGSGRLRARAGRRASTR